MKETISKRLFYIITLIVIVITLTYFLLNTLILEKYYVSNKQEQLVDIYKRINTLLDSKQRLNDESVKLELERLSENKNINITILAGDGTNLYNSSLPIEINKSKSMTTGIIRRLEIFDNGQYKETITTQINQVPMRIENKDEIDQFTNYTFKKKLKNTDKYSIELHGSERLNTDFIILTANLNDNIQLITRTSVQTISDSVKIFNKFLLIIGGIGVIAGAIAAYVISKQFTRPIQKLDRISSKIANLDFSEKYEDQSKDEIGKLGQNINKLSETLEKTINDLKKTNLELEKDIEEKSKIDDMRKQFLSDVSHELKTPIALIQGYAEGLVENVANDEESRKYYCRVIMDEAERMDKLVKQLLTLSKIEYGNEKAKIQVFNITELIEEVIRKYEVVFKAENIEVATNMDKKYYVLADEFMIEQVLNNYINNAVKHVNENKKIKISLNLVENSKVRITVFNTGKGIPEEDHIKIWTRFYKSDASRNREDGGVGIGLALVKAILTKHNNKYGVQNVDNGVEFFFELDLEEKESNDKLN